MEKLTPEREREREEIMYRLYAKCEGDKTYKPVDWNGGRQVTNLIYATLFTEEEKKTLERVDLAHPDNAEISFEFRKVKMN